MSRRKYVSIVFTRSGISTEKRIGRRLHQKLTRRRKRRRRRRRKERERESNIKLTLYKQT